MRMAQVGALFGTVLLTACGEQASPSAAADGTGDAAQAPSNTSTAEPAVDATPGVLAVGDAAPPLSASRWFLGEERTAVTPGRVTLVEFWATWCGPCIAAMPHISSLARELGDEGLDVVAVSLDRGDDAAQVVESFLQERADIVDFEVMLDDGETNRTWFEAAGQTGIPSSFVVAQDGRLAWIGHPMRPASQGDGYELDRVIKGLLDGTYDIDAQASAANEAASAAAEIAAQVDELSAEMGRLWSAGDRRGVLDYIDQIVAIDPESSHDLAQRKVEILLFELGEADEALDAAKSMLAGPYEDDASMQLMMASLFSGAADPGEAGRAFAVSTAQDVVALTDGTEPNALVVLAEAHFAAGQPESAAGTLRAAMSLVDDTSPAHETYELVLSRYLAASGDGAEFAEDEFSEDGPSADG